MKALHAGLDLFVHGLQLGLVHDGRLEDTRGDVLLDIARGQATPCSGATSVNRRSLMVPAEVSIVTISSAVAGSPG